MNLFAHLRLSHRLALGFGVVLLLLLAIAGLSLQRMNGLSQTLDRVAVSGAERTQSLTELERSAYRFMIALRDMPGAELSEGAKVMSRAREEWTAYAAAQQKVTGALPQGDAAVDAMLAEIDRHAVQVHALIPMGEKAADGHGDTAAFFAIREAIMADQAKWTGLQRDWSKALAVLASWDDQGRQAQSAQATASADSARWLVVAGGLLALVVGTVTAWLITRDVTRGIAAAVAATDRMAHLDLSEPVRVDREDELGMLARSLETMRLSQHELAAGVRQACGDIAQASAEIAQGSQDLSGRTEQAAITLQGAIGAITQLTGSVDQTAQSAHAANGLATDAQSAASRGGEVVARAVATMGEIDAASRQIADITAIIDGIAFQTNILALNAAVEAARAGEQGRGFAVVASEVRGLAQRSATAAKEIKTLIEATLDKVASGSQHVKHAGDATQEIVASVQRVSGTIASISGETDQQRHGIGQANASVGELDQVAQQNAALAEQSAAAAGSLEQQARRLTQLVARFKLDAAVA